MVCPGGQHPRNSSSSTLCLSPACSEADTHRCCQSNDLCVSADCLPGHHVNPNATNTTCLSPRCSAADHSRCCVQNERCGTHQCPAGQHLNPLASNRTCLEAACSTADTPQCCLPNALCNSLVCPPAFNPRASAASTPCTRALCTDIDVPVCCEPAAPACPRCFESVSFACTWLTPATSNWSLAESQCREDGGHLISVHSIEQQQQLSVAFSGVKLWIGATDQSSEGMRLWIAWPDVLDHTHNAGTFVWSDGSPFDFESWQPGEPNNSPNEGRPLFGLLCCVRIFRVVDYVLLCVSVVRVLICFSVECFSCVGYVLLCVSVVCFPPLSVH